MINYILESICGTFGVLILTTVALFVYYIRKKQQYWQNLGIVTPPVTFFFGNILNGVFQKDAFADRNLKFYNVIKSNNCKHGGMYIFTTPIYVPVDIDIIKHIMITDFQHFVDRGLYINEKEDPLQRHLFALEGKKWKILRNKMSPTFTSGKLKMMLGGVLECGRNLKEVMDTSLGKAVEIKDINARYTTDVIGKTAFGIECNSLKQPNNKFRQMGNRTFERGMWTNLKILLAIAMPNLMRSFNVVINDKETTDFFFDIVRSTVDYREKNNIIGKDFMQLLIELKNKGQLLDDNSANKSQVTIHENTITFEEIVAQAFIFFEAGFETSSTTMTWALYELSKNQDMQEKARKEILECITKHGGEITYEALQEMHYLERVIQESLRKYPPLSSLTRVVTKTYKVPGTDLVLKKDTKVMLPIIGIQRDEKYYPDPEKFDPDRFTEENKKNRPQCAWMPFGEGPRICIGLRFGIIETKVGLITMLKNYKFKVNQKTKEPIIFDQKTFIVSALGGIWLDFEAL